MTDDTRLLSKSIAAGVGGVGLLIALMITIQLIGKIITLDYYPAMIYFAFISNLFVIPLLLFLATKFSIFKLPALLWVHVSMSLMIIFFSQTYSPFTVTWSILILISSIYYSWKGFILSSVMLFVTAVGYIGLFPNNFSSLLSYSFLSAMVVALTMFTSYLFVRVIMTSRKQTREIIKAHKSEMLQINRLNTLLNSISDPVLTLNRYGRITSQNASAQAFFDMNQSLIGHSVDTLLNLRDDDDKYVTIIGMIDEIKTTSMHDNVSTEIRGDVHYLSLQLSRIRSTFDDNEEYGVVLIIRDITKQKTLEEEKDEFISVTSHELRTPVAIAEGSLSNFLVMMDRHMDEKKLRDAAEGAYEQIIYLSKMINDLSTLSRAERGVGENPEPIDVNNLLVELYGRYESEASAKSLRLDLDLQSNIPEIHASRLYLEEIIQNFITNAIKYTKEGSVTIGAETQPGGLVRFFVSDTGIGISKSDQQHIFEKFYRSEDYRTRETNGTGLGLYVVRKLAAKLDTRIQVSSRLNHGSTFSFLLPIGTQKASVDFLSGNKVEEHQKSLQPTQ